QLKQIVMNLCLNARDAMSAGGAMTISTHIPESRNGDHWVHLSVADTGCGMSEDIRSQVFEPFFFTKEQGTGLGLAVVYRIIQAYGGRIEAASQPGKETRFDMWFVRAGDKPR